MKAVLLKDHKKGIRLLKKNKYEEAIQSFEKSAEFFLNHKWVDKYRFLTLLDSSKESYREMDLNNILYCYSQMNNNVKAKEYYEKMLKEFPDSEVAKSPLNLSDAEKSN